MSYKRFKLAKTGSMVKDIYVYTEFKENWQYFFNEPTMVPDAPGEVDKQIVVKEHKRQRYPGDPGRTVKQSARIYVRRAKTKGSARPGRTYWVIEPGVLSGVKEKRQFSIVGTDMDLAAYAKAKAKFLVKLKGENGWGEEIPGAVGGTTAPAATGGP